MKMVRQFGIVILFLVSYLAPSMLCVVSDAQMNAPERLCCQTMSDQCGHGDLSAAQSCCRTAPANNGESVLATRTAFHPVLTAVVYAGVSDLLPRPVNAIEWVDRPDRSPPESPPASVSVLKV